MQKKILIVDDNQNNRALLRQLLCYHGYEVIESPDGASCLRTARACSPDLILLDLHMPVMDGFSVLRELRGAPDLASLKVIAVTSYAMTGDRERVLAAGFDEYVTKPIDTRKFPELIKAFITGTEP